MCSGRTQDLEEQQPSVEQELRRLMDKPGEGLEETHPTQVKTLSRSCEIKMCLCLSRTSENILGPEERGGADGQTGGDRQ